MLEAFADPAANLPAYLGGHMRLSLGAIATGLAISIPLGIAAAKNARIAGPALTFASVMQTIPSLALLALMVPLLGGMIGFLPAFIALTLYGVLPVLRNTIVGLQGVDPTVCEAARGVGMTPVQSLLRVELPLALPSIVAGVRTATVWVVGTATLATPVGATSLGNYIFAGLQTRNWTTVVFGCLAAATLALVLDQLIRLVEVAVSRRKRRLGLGAGAGIALLVLGSLAPTIWPQGAGRDRAQGLYVAEETGFGREPVVIGSKPFTEQYILAEVVEQLLGEAGARTQRRENLGSSVGFDALVSGEVDVMIDYTGTLWVNVLDREAPAPRHLMHGEISAHLLREYGVLTLGRLGFENAYGFAVTEETAGRHDLRTIGNLKRIEDLSIGADPEFFARPEWVRVREAYDLSGATLRNMDATFMYSAVRDGRVDAVTAYTTDGRIAAFGLEILEDPAGALPPYDAVILLSPEAAHSPAIHRALEPLIGAIDVELMREANAAVDLERQPVSAGARIVLEAVRE